MEDHPLHLALRALDEGACAADGVGVRLASPRAGADQRVGLRGAPAHVRVPEDRAEGQRLRDRRQHAPHRHVLRGRSRRVGDDRPQPALPRVPGDGEEGAPGPGREPPHPADALHPAAHAALQRGLVGIAPERLGVGQVHRPAPGADHLAVGGERLGRCQQRHRPDQQHRRHRQQHPGQRPAPLLAQRPARRARGSGGRVGGGGELAQCPGRGRHLRPGRGLGLRWRRGGLRLGLGGSTGGSRLGLRGRGLGLRRGRRGHRRDFGCLR